MKILWIALAIFGVLLLLLLSIPLYAKATIRAVYKKKLRLVLQIGKIPITLISDKEKKPKDLKPCRNPRRILKRELRLHEKRRIKNAKKQRKKLLKQQKKAEKKALEKGKPKPNAIDYVQMAGSLLRKLYKNTSGRIDFRIRRLHLSVACRDSADTALLYATTQQGVIYLLHWVETHFNYVKKDPDAVRITAGFGTEKTQADVDVSASMHLSAAIAIAIGMLRAYRREKTLAKHKAQSRAYKKSRSQADDAA